MDSVCGLLQKITNMKLTIHKRFQTKLILIGQYEKRANIVLATENITTENNVPLHMG